MMFVSLILFLRMYCNMCSLNSFCKKDFNILSSLMNLFYNGFTAAYLLFSNLIICTFLVLLFSVMYIFFVIFIKYC